MKQHINHGLFHWTEQSIKWYETAAQQGGFHIKIIERLKPYLSCEDHLCEIACGTGFFARSIASLVNHVTINDVHELALHYNLSQIELCAIDNIDIVPGNWQTALKGRSFDIVFFSFFAAFLKDWERLRALSTKYIIGILPTETGIQYSHKPERETWEMVSKFLTEKQISHNIIPMSLDFGQPFSDYTDAMEYFNYYYDMPMDENLKNYLDKKLDKTEYGFYFPKIKYFGIIIVRVE